MKLVSYIQVYGVSFYASHWTKDMVHMRCIVCGENINKYAFIGKKKDVKAAFCVKHIPDCGSCDSCNLRCLK